MQIFQRIGAQLRNRHFPAADGAGAGTGFGQGRQITVKPNVDRNQIFVDLQTRLRRSQILARRRRL